MVTEIRTSSLFERHYTQLPDTLKARAKEKEKVFRRDPFDPRLKTHKLHGKEEGLWAFWITYRYRIKFFFLTDEEVLFLDIGTHRIYR